VWDRRYHRNLRSAERSDHAALAYVQLPGFMEGLREREAIAARSLEFAILCAARTGEVIGAKVG
jgi:hypothetical protein